MPSRDWRKWPRRIRDEANSEAGVVALLTAAVTGGGVFLASTVVVAIGATVTVAAIGWCTYKAVPPRRPRPQELMGQVITNLTVLETINPPVRRIGFVGPSRSGKSTLLARLQAEVPKNIRTDEPYAVIVLLQTKPVAYFALIDAAGQEYSQQFRVCNEADGLVVMFDHSELADVARISNDRLTVHENHLESV